MAYFTNRAIETIFPKPSNTGFAPVTIDVRIGDVNSSLAVGDVINLLKFPVNTVLEDDSIVLSCVTADLDSNATTTLAWDLQVSSDLAGTSPTLLEGAVDVAEVGDSAVLTSQNGLTDVSSKYLQLRVDAAFATFNADGVARLELVYSTAQTELQPYAIYGLSVITA